MTASHNPFSHPHLHVFPTDATTRSGFIAMRDWCDQHCQTTSDYDARWDNYDDDDEDLGDAWFAFVEPRDLAIFKLKWAGA